MIVTNAIMRAPCDSYSGIDFLKTSLKNSGKETVTSNCYKLPVNNLLSTG